MSTMFQPKRADGRAVWRVIFDDITTRIKADALKVNDVIPHSEMRSLLNKNEQGSYYAAIHRVSDELAKTIHRSLQPARSVGYRLIAGTGQVEFGQAHRKRGVRNMRKGLALVKTADRSLMTTAERTWADKVECGMVTLATITAMHDERLIEIDAQLNELRTASFTSNREQKATNEEVAELKRRVDEILAKKDAE